uniref:Uncharacterized protein n=1 Tax=Scophthalmus maximus TaxID=52904 RepID=A0A8D3DRJ6_SCOMX
FLSYPIYSTTSCSELMNCLCTARDTLRGQLQEEMESTKATRNKRVRKNLYRNNRKSESLDSEQAITVKLEDILMAVARVSAGARIASTDPRRGGTRLPEHPALRPAVMNL